MGKKTPPTSFEKAMTELDAIVNRMEDGELPLDDMLAAYKRGAQLARYCRDKLDHAQQEIRSLENEQLTPANPTDYD